MSSQVPIYDPSDLRAYEQALREIAPGSSTHVTEFLAIMMDPDWECIPYYSTTKLTATIRPQKNELGVTWTTSIWNQVECRFTPEDFARVVATARLCSIPVKTAIRVLLAHRFFTQGLHS